MFYSFYIVRHRASLSVHLLPIVYLMIVDFSLQIRCDVSLLLATLCSRTIQTREGSIVKALDCSAAAASRDALAKTVYARLFDWYLFLFFFIFYLSFFDMFNNSMFAWSLQAC